MKRLVSVVFCILITLTLVNAQAKVISNKSGQAAGTAVTGVTSISLSRDHLSSNETDRSVTVTINGYDLNALKALHVQLSQNGKNQSPVQCKVNSNGTEATAVVTVPTGQSSANVTETITVRVIENFTSISDVSAVIKITPPAAVSRISVDAFSEGDTAISLKLSGRNLDIRGETVISVVDSDGNEAAECRTVLPPPVQTVEEEPSVSVSWEIGDLVFKDGSIVALDDYNKRRMGIPMGVIAYERDGEPYMVGVSSITNANNGNGMRWCSYYAGGYDSIPELNAWADDDYVAYAEITGLNDGSEAWNIIQMADPDHADEADEYYPAFWYAETYGEEYNLYGTKYETGWFIPTLWELAEIYRNSDEINDAFYEFANYDMGYRRYRSSSQNPYSSSYSTGINFDEGYIWETYSSKDESDVYVMVVCPVSGSSGNTSNTIETLIPVPYDSGIFSIQVSIDGVLQSAAGRIQIAGDPEITRVELPDVSKDYCGEEISVIIYGKNFTVAGMSADKFIVFGLEASPVRIISDTQAAVTITYPDAAGSYDVTFVCNESMITESLSILDSVSATWAPGDIILSDGSKVAAADASRMTATQKSKAVAVVAFSKYGLIPFGMGLEQNDNIYMMEEYCNGYNAMIDEISCERSNSWYADDDVTVTGDKDGYDNWAVVQALDPNGARNASSTYPGFWWAQNYGISHSLPASCSDGWFVPSLSELIEIYRNRNAINKSLSALGKTSLMRGWYSTSSQDPDDSDYIWRIDFSDGEIDTGYKDSSRYELVIRQFASAGSSSSNSGINTTTIRR
ncbi:MAG: hypothetical protein KBT02_07540 [Treponema sp.]|nr:hypothetical protein [Candidatus Treponema caballi]